MKLQYITITLLTAALASLEAQNWEYYTTGNSGLASDNVLSICPATDGMIWFATDKGLCAFDGSVWVTYTGESACPTAHDKINKVFYDGQRVWAASDSGISAHFLPADEDTACSVLYRTNNSGLIYNLVWSIAADTAGHFWFGTDSGLSIMTVEEWLSVVQGEHLNNNRIRSLGAGYDGWVYAGTDGGGVGRLRLNEVDAVTSASALTQTWSGLLSDTVLAVFVDKSGKRWYGTDQGVSSHNSPDSKKGWEIITEAQGLPDNYVQAVAEDSSGGMWFGTKSGAARKSEKGWRYFTTSNGLLSDDIVDIAVSADGSVWFASPSGLARLLDISTAIQRKTKEPQNTSFAPKVYPNPFNSFATFAFYLPKNGRVAIDIYDMRGRLIRSLFHQYLSAGKIKMSWDGKNGNGRNVSSGMYFLRIRIGRQIFIRKLSFIR